MKKTLLSLIAVSAVVGSAFGVPSPADRKALCEKHPDKYVWVEKTQACVPINPCKSDNAAIKNVYCIGANDNVTLPKDQLDLVLERYAEKVLKTTLLSKQFLEDGEIAIVTSDGGYAVINIEDYTDYSDPNHRYRYGLATAVAAWAYGYELEIADFQKISEDELYLHTDRIVGNLSQTECEDIRDFASLIGNYIFDSEYSEGNCLIKNTMDFRK